MKSTRAYGLRHAAQPLHRTGSYGTTGMSGRCFRGVTSAPKGTTHFVASILLFGQTFLRADRAKGSRSDSTVRGRNARAARRDVRATTARGGHERGGRGVIAALPTRRGRSGKNPRTMIDGPRPPPRGHPSPGSACRRPFLALAANVNPAAPPPCRDPGVLRAYASIERDGWRARIERPPAGVCVEDARAILCRGGRGQTVAECSPPAIRSSSGGRRAGGRRSRRENAKTSSFVLDRMISQSYKHTYRIYQTIFAYVIHHTSVLRGRLVKRALILHVALFPERARWSLFSSPPSP